MKIVVFGASGNTGTYFIKYFLENNKDKKYENSSIWGEW